MTPFLLVAMFGDWFGGESAWETMAIARVVFVVLVLCAFALVVLTVSRAVAMATSAATLTSAVGMLALPIVVYLSYFQVASFVQLRPFAPVAQAVRAAL